MIKKNANYLFRITSHYYLTFLWVKQWNWDHGFWLYVIDFNNRNIKVCPIKFDENSYIVRMILPIHWAASSITMWVKWPSFILLSVNMPKPTHVPMITRNLISSSSLMVMRRWLSSNSPSYRSISAASSRFMDAQYLCKFVGNFIFLSDTDLLITRSMVEAVSLCFSTKRAAIIFAAVLDCVAINIFAFGEWCNNCWTISISTYVFPVPFNKWIQDEQISELGKINASIVRDIKYFGKYDTHLADHK